MKIRDYLNEGFFGKKKIKYKKVMSQIENDKEILQEVKLSPKEMSLFKNEHPEIKKQAQKILIKLIKNKGDFSKSDLWNAETNFDNSIFSDGFTEKFIKKIFDTYKNITGNKVKQIRWLNTNRLI